MNLAKVLEHWAKEKDKGKPSSRRQSNRRRQRSGSNQNQPLRGKSPQRSEAVSASSASQSGAMQALLETAVTDENLPQLLLAAKVLLCRCSEDDVQAAAGPRFDLDPAFDLTSR